MDTFYHYSCDPELAYAEQIEENEIAKNPETKMEEQQVFEYLIITSQ